MWTIFRLFAWARDYEVYRVNCKLGEFQREISPLRHFCPLEIFTRIISGTPGSYSFESELLGLRH